MSAENDEEGGNPLNIEAVMEDVRRSVTAEVARTAAGTEPFNQAWWDARAAKNRRDLEEAFVALLHNPELYTLNTSYRWFEEPVVSSHRRFLGKWIVKWKTYTFDLIGRQLFGDYLRREAEFQVHLVRFLNAVAAHVDSRDERLFWQVMHKVDSDVEALNARADVLFNETAKSVAALSERVRRLSPEPCPPAEERWGNQSKTEECT